MTIQATAIKAPAPERVAEDAVELLLEYYSTLYAPVNEADLLEYSRNPYTVKVRTVVAYFLKTECNWSYKAIGSRLGRDHSSVIDMVRRVQNMASAEEIDEAFSYAKDGVSKRLEGRRKSLMRGGKK